MEEEKEKVFMFKHFLHVLNNLIIFSQFLMKKMDIVYSVFSNNYFPQSLSFIMKAKINSWLTVF